MYDDIENNRVYSYADYFDSVLGAQLIREFGYYLNFPVNGKFKLKSYNRNQTLDFIDSQIYDRMSASMIAIHKSEQKKEFLINSTSNPNKISSKGFLEIFRFLKYYSRSHFMGHICELFGFITVASSIEDYDTCPKVIIPGSSISIKGKNGIKQGPDGLVVEIKKIDNKYQMEIFGIIEIKSYRVSQNKLVRQLKKHKSRLQEETLLVTQNGTEENASFAYENDETTTATVQYDNIHFNDAFKYYALVPAYKRKVKKHKELILLELPWTPKGFRNMGLYFFLWIVENFGRIGDETNYQRGVESWITLLERALQNERMTKKSKTEVRQVLNYFKNGIKGVDQEWM